MEKIQFWLKSDRTKVYFTWRSKYNYGVSLDSSGEWEMLQRKVLRKSKHILCSVSPPRENRAVYKIMLKKNGWTRSAAEGNIIRRMCLACQKTNPRIHTLKICNNYCVSTATMVARTPLIVTLYVHCLSRVFASVWKAHACIHTTPRCNAKDKGTVIPLQARCGPEGR